MCLYIDKKHKSFLTKKWKAKRTHKDIWVWKILAKPYLCYYWVTPFQRKKIYFKDGKCVLESFTKKDFESTVSGDCIGALKSNCGYHSYLKETNNIDSNERLFRAKIPRGSYVYYGNHNEICSNKLIIFETTR